MLQIFRKPRNVGVTEGAEAKSRGALCFDGLRPPNINKPVDSGAGNNSTVVSAPNYGAIVSPTTRNEFAGLSAIPADLARSVAATASEIRQHPVSGTVEWGLRARATPTSHEGLTNSEMQSFVVAYLKERDGRIARGQDVSKTDAILRNQILSGAYGDLRPALLNPPVVPITVSTGPAAVLGNQLVHVTETESAAVAADSAAAQIHAGAALTEYNEALKAHVGERMAKHMVVKSNDTFLPVPPRMLAEIKQKWEDFGSDKPMLWFFFHSPEGHCRMTGENVPAAVSYDNMDIDDLHEHSKLLVEGNRGYVTKHRRAGETVACYPHALINKWLQANHAYTTEFESQHTAHLLSGSMLPGDAGIHAGCTIEEPPEEGETFDPHSYVEKIASCIADGYTSEGSKTEAAIAAGDLFEDAAGTVGRLAGTVGNIPEIVAGRVSVVTGKYAAAAAGNEAEVITEGEARRREKALRDAGFKPEAIAAAMANTRVDGKKGRGKKTKATRSGDALVLEDGYEIIPSKTMLRLSRGVRDKDSGFWMTGEKCHKTFLSSYFPMNAKALRAEVKSMSKNVMKMWGFGSLKKVPDNFVVTEYAVNRRAGFSDELYLPNNGYSLDDEAAADVYEMGYWIYPTSEKVLMIDGVKRIVSSAARLWISHVFVIKRGTRLVDHFMQWTTVPGESKSIMHYCNAVRDIKPIGRVFTTNYTSQTKVTHASGNAWPTSIVHLYAAN
jgi:hypothetical protein